MSHYRDIEIDGIMKPGPTLQCDLQIKMYVEILKYGKPASKVFYSAATTDDTK